MKYTLLLAIGILLAGCDFGNRYIVVDQPTAQFKYECHQKKAFRLFKDNKGRWACKLENGKVLIDE